jgi:predicted hotdog family 3-hydroxylacyl-ACP dehydratase
MVPVKLNKGVVIVALSIRSDGGFGVFSLLFRKSEDEGKVDTIIFSLFASADGGRSGALL